MSKAIDQRIVEMDFDNEKFQSNAQDTVKTLDTLKKALNLEEAASGLNGLSAAGKSLNLSSIAEGVQSLSDRFSAMGIVGMTIIQNLTNGAIAAGKQMLDNLILNPARMGLQEYETQLNAIQTTLANTQSKGTTLDQVNAALDTLNTYSDKTIYNFTEMARNIGTFTAAGVDLDTSVNAIKGIANLAAVSGSNAQQASTAMYQLSQALSSGTVKLQDWNSVVNAGMGGQVFQDALKETARVHGIAIDKIIKEEGSFRESLQKGWLTSSILTETLSKFTGDLTAEQLKAIGYTEDQIAGIQKLGQTANEAATKVKTFSQLKDTLMEALQSGWGQTWRLIIGDFEEARTFFTDFSNIFGNMISESANSRNEILKDWKKFGGRFDLIDGIRNAFDALMSVMKPVSEAFSTIFPPITGYRLKLLTVGFKNLMASLKMGEQTATKVKTIFMGIASVFKLAIDGVVLLGKSLWEMLKKVPVSGNSILDFLVNIANFLIKIKDTFSSVENFKNAMASLKAYLTDLGLKAKSTFVEFIASFSSIEKMKTMAKNVGGAVGMLLANAIPGITTFLRKLGPFGDAILNVFGKIGAILSPAAKFVVLCFDSIRDAFIRLTSKTSDKKPSGFLDGLLKDFKPFEKMGDVLPKIIDAVTKKLQDFSPMLDSIGEKSKGIFASLGTAIGNGLKNIDFNGLMAAIASAGIAGIILSIGKAFKKGAGAVDSVAGIFDGIKEALGGVKDSLKAWQDSLKANVITKIAIAIGILALALFALSFVDSDKLIVALGSIVVLFKTLMMSMEEFQKMSSGSSFKSIGKVVLSLLAISVAVLILSAALGKLAGLDAASVIAGVTAIVALSAALVKSTAALSNITNSDFAKQAAGIAVFGLGLYIMTMALKKVSEIDPNKMASSLLGLAGILTSLSLFLKYTNLDGVSAKKAIGIIALAAGLAAMSLALKLLGSIDPNTVAQGLVTMGVVLAELAAFMRLSGDPKNMITTSIGIAILAAAMLLLTLPLKALAAIPQQTITDGLLRMGIALGIIGLAMRLLPNDTLGKAVGLAIVGGALYILAGALGQFGNLPLETIAKGMFAVIGLLAALAISMNVMKDTISGAVALLIASAALAVMAGVLKVIGSMPIEAIGIALAALAGVFIIIGVAATVLGPMVPVLLGLAGAVLMVGVAVAAIGGGVFLFAAGLASLVATLYALGPLIPILSDNFAKAIIGFSMAIQTATPVIIATFMMMLEKLLSSIISISPQLMLTAGALLLKLIETIAMYTPRFVQAGFSILTGLLTGIRDNIGQIVTLSADIVDRYITALTDKLPELIDTGWKFVIAIIDGWSASVEENMPTLMASVGRLAGAIIDGLVEGIIDGIFAFGNSFKDLIDGGIKAFKEKLGIHSPSTVFYDFGTNIIQGLINGIASMIENVKAKIGEVVSGMSEKINTLASDFLQAGKDLVQQLIDGLGNKASDLKDKAGSIVDSAKDAVTAKYNDFMSAGKSLVQGIIDGINALSASLVDAAATLLTSVLDKLKALIGLGGGDTSGDTGVIGDRIVIGIADAITNSGVTAVNAAQDLGSSIFSALNTAIGQTSDLLSDSLDANPTITPVLDLSNIIEGTQRINSMFGEKSLGLAAANSSRFEAQTKQPESYPSNTQTSTDGPITFVQNNYSPEALSRYEIYRQTRNQLKTFKGLVKRK